MSAVIARWRVDGMISLVCNKQDLVPADATGIHWLDPEADYLLAKAYWRGRGQELSRETWEEAHAAGYRYAALLREGQILSCAAAWRYSDHAWEVAAVGTLPAFRRQGYATRVVAFVTAYILAASRVATCHTAEDNAAMRATARRVGFREVAKGETSDNDTA
jgi:predicted GNAT family acetyltransferase